MKKLDLSEELINFTKSIASETRLNILLLFLDGQERTVNQITEAIGLGQPTVSEHLAIMRQSGVLLSNKRGKAIYYRPDRVRIARYLEVVSNVLNKCCEA